MKQEMTVFCEEPNQQMLDLLAAANIKMIQWKPPMDRVRGKSRPSTRTKLGDLVVIISVEERYRDTNAVFNSLAKMAQTSGLDFAIGGWQIADVTEE